MRCYCGQEVDCIHAECKTLVEETTKDSSIEQALNAFTKEAFGRERTLTQCVMCGSDMVQRSCFKNPESWREFHLSRTCQKCQDKVFSIKEEEE